MKVLGMDQVPRWLGGKSSLGVHEGYNRTLLSLCLHMCVYKNKYEFFFFFLPSTDVGQIVILELLRVVLDSSQLKVTSLIYNTGNVEREIVNLGMTVIVLCRKFKDS